MATDLHGHAKGVAQQTLGRHPLAFGIIMAGMGLLIIILMYYVNSWRNLYKASASCVAPAGSPPMTATTTPALGKSCFGAPFALTSANHQLVEQDTKNVGGSSTNRPDDAVRRAGYYLNQNGDMVPAGANRAIHSQRAGTSCPKWSNGASAEASALAEVGQFQFDNYDGESTFKLAAYGGDHNIGTAAQIAAWTAKDAAAYKVTAAQALASQNAQQAAFAKKMAAQPAGAVTDDRLTASMNGM